MLDVFSKISTEVISGNIEETKRLTQQALDGGASAKEVLDKGLLPGMDIVGQRFKVCEMFIPEVLRSAKCMHEATDIIRPFLSASDAAGAGTVVLGTVEGDLHDIGKNLVGMMLEGAGFKVIDLGVDIKPQVFVKAVKDHQPHILGMSALLTTTMLKMEETIVALKEAGIRGQVKVMIGGAPVTGNFAKEIGADGYGSNAQTAIEKAKELLELSLY